VSRQKNRRLRVKTIAIGMIENILLIEGVSMQQSDVSWERIAGGIFFGIWLILGSLTSWFWFDIIEGK
jgi:hypothetical protein